MSDSRQRFPWVKLSTEWLTTQASNGQLPVWQRVAFIAFAKVNHRGVASMGPYGLAWRVAANHTTGKGSLAVDMLTGELAESTYIPRAINQAIEKGWLGKASTEAECHVPKRVLEVGRVYGATPFRKAHRKLLKLAMEDKTLPAWQRLFWASLAHLSPKGVAYFKEGELARLVGSSNPGRDLSEAVRVGWLAEGSTLDCVVVPSEVASVGSFDLYAYKIA